MCWGSMFLPFDAPNSLCSCGFPGSLSEGEALGSAMQTTSSLLDAMLSLHSFSYSELPPVRIHASMGWRGQKLQESLTPAQNPGRIWMDSKGCVCQ